MKYLIYCRRSSEDTKQSQSLDTQLNILGDFVKRTGLEVVDKIIESKSAKEDGQRPGFDELLTRISSGEADSILVAHIDRLSRNGTDSAKLTKLLTKGQLKEIRTPYKIYDTSKDILMMEIELAMAAEYSRNLSIRVSEGIANKLRKGYFVGWAPIGYKNKGGSIVRDPTQVDLVQTAFKMYATGSYSLQRLCSELFLTGYRSRSGNKVSKSQLHKILTNPVYYGAIRYDGNIYKGRHRPLVSKTVFDQVQAIFKGLNRSKKQTHDFLYRDYLSCGNCGCKLTAITKKGKYKYYYCTNGKRICNEHRSYMDEDYIYNLVLENIRSIPKDRKMMELAFLEYKSRMISDTDNLEDRRKSIEKSIKTIQKKIDRLVDLHIEGEIDKEAFSNKRTRLNDEKLTLEDQLTHTNSKSLNSSLELVENWKNRVFSLEEMFATKDEQIQSDLLKSLVLNFSIQSKEVANYQYKLPYAYLQKLPKNATFENWLPS